MNNIQRMIALILFTLIAKSDSINVEELSLQEVPNSNNQEYFGSGEDYYFVRFVGQGVSSDLVIQSYTRKNFLRQAQIDLNETDYDQIANPTLANLGAEFITDFMLLSKADIAFESGSIKIQGYKLV